MIKMAKRIIKLCTPSGSQPYYSSLSYETVWQYISTDRPRTEASNAWGEHENYFRPIAHFISEKIRYGAIVTMEY